MYCACKDYFYDISCERVAMKVLEQFFMEKEPLLSPTTAEMLGQQLVLLRNTKGWTQDKAAEQTGLHPRTLKGLELGQVNPNLSTLEQIAKGYGVTLAALFDPWKLGADGAVSHLLCKKLEEILKDPIKGQSIKTVINSLYRNLK